MKVPFLDLRSAYIELKPEIDAAIAKVLHSGCYIGGDEVEAFESEWAAYCESKYSVGVGNGLDALRFSLLSLDIGPGDEVIVPSNTFIASWLAISHCGATPVPVEPEESTYNINPKLIEQALTKRTKAILITHLYGQPADIDPILAITKSHSLKLIEDAAQAHGARYKGRRIGAHGDVTAWSFYPGKNLGAMGDGGAITTNDEKIAERVRTLSNYGSKKKYFNEIQGFNSRLDPIQAAILRVKLKHLDDWNLRRKGVAKKYSDTLSNKITLSSDKNKNVIKLPYADERSDHVWHLYVIRHPNRDSLAGTLQSVGVHTMIHYPLSPARQKAYSNLKIKEQNRSISSILESEILSLPIGPHLDNEKVSYTLTALLNLNVIRNHNE